MWIQATCRGLRPAGMDRASSSQRVRTVVSCPLPHGPAQACSLTAHVQAGMHVCMRACMHACMCACVRVCVCISCGEWRVHFEGRLKVKLVDAAVHVVQLAPAVEALVHSSQPVFNFLPRPQVPPAGAKDLEGSMPVCSQGTMAELVNSLPTP